MNAAKCSIGNSSKWLINDDCNHYDSFLAAFSGLSANQFEDISSYRGCKCLCVRVV